VWKGPLFSLSSQEVIRAGGDRGGSDLSSCQYVDQVRFPLFHLEVKLDTEYPMPTSMI
jgi:hypothetical protein